MGIHDRLDPLSRVVQLPDLETSQIVAGNYTSDDASSMASEQPIVRRQTRRSRAAKAAAIDYQSFAERLHCRSKRHAKRRNHLNIVKTLVGLEESEIESDFAWTPENYGRSIFSSLFAESEKMKVWNTFIEMNEEDQLLMIEDSGMSEQASTTELPDLTNFTLTEGQFVDFNLSSDDKRNVHPSYSSEECFKHIKQNIRNLLKRRHVPLGLLENVELQIREKFMGTPYSLYEVAMETSFGRLLVHAVTQYLGLASISFDHGATRMVTVVNKAETFNPPAELLSEYLEWKSGRHQAL